VHSNKHREIARKNLAPDVLEQLGSAQLRERTICS
jgi:hypothetical protein